MLQKLVLFTTFCLLSWSCANIVAPTGGKKDETPPQLVEASPANQSTHFISDKIEFEFDEFVQLKDIENQFIISPELKEKPKLKVRKKTIELSFSELPQPLTTYTINFGNSIADLTETNPLRDFVYAFSTGDFLDSLTLSGSVINSETQAPEKNVIVLLHQPQSDSSLYKDRPVYFTRTKEDGHFTFSNLKAADYQLFALKETNNTKLYDSKDEWIAFESKTLHLPKDSATHTLSLFKELPAFKLLEKQFHTDGKINLIFSRPAQTPVVKLVKQPNADTVALTEPSIQKDTLAVWLPLQNTDSVELRFADQTLMFDTTVKVAVSFDKISPLHISHNLKQTKLVPGNPLVLTFSRPLISYASDSITLIEDSLKYLLPLAMRLDTFKRKLEIKYDWRAESTYQLELPANTFKDIFGKPNSTTILTFSVHDIKNYGTLTFKLSAKIAGNYIVELLDSKNNLVSSEVLAEEKTLLYNNLNPGSYRLKVISDENNNHRWDTGNYREKKQAEKIVFYPGEINLRANWDLELDWNF